jgi:hypothetical protein
MKKFSLLLASVSLISRAALSANEWIDVSQEIPLIQNPLSQGFKKIPDVAQYGEADWSQAIGIARGISVEEAFKIANENPEITYFFYTKGWQMVLGTGDGNWRIFRHGDTVFFKGESWWGEANNLADGYMRNNSN